MIYVKNYLRTLFQKKTQLKAAVYYCDATKTIVSISEKTIPSTMELG